VSYDAEAFDAFEAAGWAGKEVAAYDALAGREGLVEGTVRLRPLVQAQNEDVQQAIRDRLDELLEEHRAGDGFEVSVAVKLGSGRKP
jgi:hypothetical protein